MGHSSDWESLFEQHFQQIYAYVAFRVAPDQEAALDIVQEVFLAAGPSHGQYRHDASPLTWLRAIARNKVADHFRAMAAIQFERELTTADDELPQRADGEAQQKAMLVSITLRRLPQEQTRLLEEKYLDGLPVGEIAQRRGISEKAAESALTRARAAFREAHERLCASELTNGDSHD